MKFVTWDWNYGKTGLYQGHYHMDDCASAKEDFTTRSGLVSENRLFNSSQLIENTQQQIESAVPDLQARIAEQKHDNTLQQNM